MMPERITTKRQTRQSRKEAVVREKQTLTPRSFKPIQFTVSNQLKAEMERYQDTLPNEERANWHLFWGDPERSQRYVNNYCEPCNLNGQQVRFRELELWRQPIEVHQAKQNASEQMSVNMLERSLKGQDHRGRPQSIRDDHGESHQLIADED